VETVFYLAFVVIFPESRFLDLTSQKRAFIALFYSLIFFVFYKLILLLSGHDSRTVHPILYFNETKTPVPYLTEMGENVRPPQK
jgi:hypothetical protein